MKPIEGFEDYFVDELGNVFSKCFHHSRNKSCSIIKLTPCLNKKGYLMLGIKNGNKRFPKTIHRLVSDAFVSNPENKKEINHINGIKTDCRAVNLEWCTRSENIKHAYKTKLKDAIKGINHSQSKLNEEQVLMIRNDVRSTRAIALEYNVGKSTIHSIKNRQIWKHI